MNIFARKRAVIFLLVLVVILSMGFFSYKISEHSHEYELEKDDCPICSLMHIIKEDYKSLSTLLIILGMLIIFAFIKCLGTFDNACIFNATLITDSVRLNN